MYILIYLLFIFKSQTAPPTHLRLTLLSGSVSQDYYSFRVIIKMIRIYFLTKNQNEAPKLPVSDKIEDTSGTFKFKRRNTNQRVLILPLKVVMRHILVFWKPLIKFHCVS